MTMKRILTICFVALIVSAKAQTDSTKIAHVDSVQVAHVDSVQIEKPRKLLKAIGNLVEGARQLYPAVTGKPLTIEGAGLKLNLTDTTLIPPLKKRNEEDY